MQHLGFGLLLYVAAVLQGGGASGMALGPVLPHFLFLAAVTAVLAIDSWTALVWAAAAGLLSDTLTGGPLGVNLFVATWTGLAVRRWLRSREESSVLALTGVTAASVFAALFLSQTARLLLTGRQSDHAEVMLAVSATTVYTATLAFAFLSARATVRHLVRRPSRSV